LGVLIYEMMAGYTPFYKKGMDQMTLFREICKGRFEFPKKKGLMSVEAQDLITRMLVTNPSRRLGSLARGSRDIFRHAWFARVNFDRIKKKETKAPWKPEIKNPLDTENFESWDHLDDKSKTRYPKLSAKDQKMFEDF
jgi:serine/threonine protein kinase